MSVILNKIMVITLCTILAMSKFGITDYLVLLVLLTTSASFLGFVCKKKSLHFFSFIACCILGLFDVPTLCFLPVLLYDVCYYPLSPILLFGILVLLFNMSPLILIIMSLCLLSFLLCKKDLKILDLEKNYRLIQDDKKEMQLELNAKNHELLEKYDIDVHLATLAERGRIAGEIHDNVGHLLTSSILQIGAILACNPSGKQIESLHILQETLSTGMDSIRDSVHNLHDSTSDLHDDMRKIINVKCEYLLEYDVEVAPNRQTHICFLFAVKEGVSNISKHSNATKVEIFLQEHPTFYQLIIRDNGTKLAEDIAFGIGIKTMHKRVEALKGNFHITTNNGYKIFISIPKEGNTNENTIN